MRLGWPQQGGHRHDHHVGIDVSLETSSNCIVDDAGVVIRELLEEKNCRVAAKVIWRMSVKIKRDPR